MSSFDLKGILASTSAVLGVNHDDHGDAMAIRDPMEAARLIAKEVRGMKLLANVYPGLSLYPLSKGCPAGGEPVGILMASPTTPQLEQQVLLLREVFNQNTVFIAAPRHGRGYSKGFVVNLGERDMRATATQWQKKAEEEYARTGVYVSGVVYGIGRTIYGQAEQDPTRIMKARTWTESAKKIIRQIEPEASPFYRPVSYKYFTRNTL